MIVDPHLLLPGTEEILAFVDEFQFDIAKAAIPKGAINAFCIQDMKRPGIASRHKVRTGTDAEVAATLIDGITDVFPSYVPMAQPCFEPLSPGNRNT